MENTDNHLRDLCREHRDHRHSTGTHVGRVFRLARVQAFANDVWEIQRFLVVLDQHKYYSSMHFAYIFPNHDTGRYPRLSAVSARGI